MNDEYLQAFIRESEENIVDLNNSLLALERDPDDRDAMDLIFRTAHTLKGNFGAMGFESASQLAHAIEDLLDEIRQGRMSVTPEVMDLVFEGVDQIELILEEIDDTGEAKTDTSQIAEEIRQTISEPSEATEATVAPGDGAGDRGASKEVDGPTVRVDVELGASEMKGVDGLLALDALDDLVDLVGTVPERSSIEAGEYENGFEVVVAGDDEEAIVEAVEAVPKVDGTTVVAVSDGADRDADGGDESPVAASAEGSGSGPRSSPNEIKSVRVDVEQLDELYSLVEQLVTSRIKLRRSVDELGAKAASDNLDELDKITAGLQNTVMDMRLMPLSKVVDTFPRLVRDLARDQDKTIDFAMEGTDVELDRTILGELSDPVMHILRNAVDHGIESPDVRERKDKPREGSIRLRATRERDHVTIEVEDDGAGLDVDAIREKAAERGLHTREELDAMDDSAVYDLVFHPGFSTSEEVTDVSGRGVGMDVVHSTISQLDGSVSVESEPDEGTIVSMRLPVTMAIVRVLFVEIGDSEFGLPVKTVDEITRMNGAKTVHGEDVIDHDDTIYRIIDLHEVLTESDERSNGDGMLIRIRESARPVALACDAVRSQEEVVIKPFEGDLSDTPGLGGTAVVGDGNVVPIIDVETLSATPG